MKFLIRHQEWFKGMAIASFVSLNFFMIAACWTGEDGAWAATFLIAAIAIVCSLVSQFIQDFLQNTEQQREETKEESTTRNNTKEIWHN